jgi:hypothetical protein
MSMESDGGMILTGETRSTRRKPCAGATLSTTNPTWIDTGANPDLRGDRPATNRLSHCTADQVAPTLYSESLLVTIHEKINTGTSDTCDKLSYILAHTERKRKNGQK